MVSTSEPLNHPLDDCQLSQCYLPTLLATFFASRAWFITCFSFFFRVCVPGELCSMPNCHASVDGWETLSEIRGAFFNRPGFAGNSKLFCLPCGNSNIMRWWTVFKLQPIRFSFVFLQFIFNSPNFEQNPFSILFALIRLVDKIKQLRSAAVKVFFSPSGLPHRTLHVVLSLCQK